MKWGPSFQNLKAEEELAQQYAIFEQQKTMMDAILAQLQLLNDNLPHGNNSKDSNEGVSRSESKDKNVNGIKGKEEDAGFHLTEDATKNKVLEDIQAN